MAYHINMSAPHPLIFRTRTPWIPNHVSEIAFSNQDENHLTTGFLTAGTFVNRGQYELSRGVGRGAFGAVCLAKDRHWGNDTDDRAIKFLPFNHDGLNELRIYHWISKKPNFTKVPFIHGVFRMFHNGVPYIGLAMEVLGPSIYRTVCHVKALDLLFAAEVVRNILEAIQYLHEEVGIAHLDISPANVLFKEKFPDGHFPPSPHIRIIDFNTSHPHNKIGDTIRYIASYRAPEVCLQMPYTCSADIWAVGAVAFYMVRGFEFLPANNALPPDIVCEKLLYAMTQSFGKIPQEMIEAASTRVPFVRHNGFEHNTLLFSEATIREAAPPRYLYHYFNNYIKSQVEKDYGCLVGWMFTVDNLRRPSARKLLKKALMMINYRAPPPEPNPYPQYRPPIPIPQDNHYSTITPDWAQPPFPHFIAPEQAVPAEGAVLLPISHIVAPVQAAAPVVVENADPVAMEVDAPVVAPNDALPIVDVAPEDMQIDAFFANDAHIVAPVDPIPIDEAMDFDPAIVVHANQFFDAPVEQNSFGDPAFVAPPVHYQPFADFNQGAHQPIYPAFINGGFVPDLNGPIDNPHNIQFAPVLFDVTTHQPINTLAPIPARICDFEALKDECIQNGWNNPRIFQQHPPVQFDVPPMQWPAAPAAAPRDTPAESPEAGTQAEPMGRQ